MTPRFQLFQPVTYGGDPCIVVGISYVCPIEALIKDLGRFGWRYELSYVFGKTPEESVGMPESESFVPESDIEEYQP